MAQQFTEEPVIPVRDAPPLWLRALQWSSIGIGLAVLAFYEVSGCPEAQTAQAEASHLTILAADLQGKAEFCAYKPVFGRASSDLYDGPVDGLCSATRDEVAADIKLFQQERAAKFHSCLVSNPFMQKIRQLF